MESKFVKYADLQQEVIFTIQNCEIFTTPYGKRFVATIDDEMKINIPLYYVKQVIADPSLLNTFSMEKNFIVYRGKTQAAENRINLIFPRVSNLVSCCFCPDNYDCEECRCAQIREDADISTPYLCSCTSDGKNKVFDLFNVKKKMLALHEIYGLAENIGDSFIPDSSSGLNQYSLRNLDENKIYVIEDVSISSNHELGEDFLLINLDNGMSVKMPPRISKKFINNVLNLQSFKLDHLFLMYKGEMRNSEKQYSFSQLSFPEVTRFDTYCLCDVNCKECACHEREIDLKLSYVCECISNGSVFNVENVKSKINQLCNKLGFTPPMKKLKLM